MSTSFTAQATNGSGQNQGSAQVVVADSTTFTGTVPAGLGAFYSIIPAGATTGWEAGSVWRWTYVQKTPAGVAEALAWGMVTKDVNGTLNDAEASGPAALSQIVTAPSNVTPQAAAYASGVQLQTAGGNTAGGHPWTCRVARWA